MRLFHLLAGVLEEARFFGIEQLAEQLEATIKVSRVDGGAAVTRAAVTAAVNVQSSVSATATVYVTEQHEYGGNKVHQVSQ